MSAVAVDTLAGLGYRDIVDLRGGMIAWQDSGRSLLPPQAAASGPGGASRGERA